MNKIAFISYYLELSDGVGSARSRYLLKLLKTDNNYKIQVLSKNSLGDSASKNRFIWIIKLIMSLREKFKCVYVSCGPFWYLPIIIFMSILFKHRLIVDFRDPWSLNIKTIHGDKYPKIKLFIAENIEKILYRICQYFVVCTHGMRDEYKYLFRDDKKIKIILNGHELSDQLLALRQVEKINNKNSIKIICVGSFASYSKDAINILEEIIWKIKKMHKNVNFEFIGTDEETIQAINNNNVLRNITIFSPKMSYAEAMSITVTADVAICLIRNETFDCGTKIYDYIGLGIPVYGNFCKEKQFYEFFKKYLIDDFSNINHFKPDFSKKFHRNTMLEPLVKMILNDYRTEK